MPRLRNQVRSTPWKKTDIRSDDVCFSSAASARSDATDKDLSLKPLPASPRAAGSVERSLRTSHTHTSSLPTILEATTVERRKNASTVEEEDEFLPNEATGNETDDDVVHDPETHRSLDDNPPSAIELAQQDKEDEDQPLSPAPQSPDQSANEPPVVSKTKDQPVPAAPPVATTAVSAADVDDFFD